MNGVGVTPRKLAFDFDHVPRYWCNGSPFMTHMLNSYTLLVPDNENYYIRHLSRYIDKLSDRELGERLRNFCRQEAQHGIEHKAFWNNLDEQGLRYEAYVGSIGWFNYRLLEPVIPQCIHLANIACIEHINAYLGEFFLHRDLLRDAEPKMRTLFNWHFAEEIEHKSVAYDVFASECGNYFARVLGALLVFPLFYLFNTAGTVYLLAQDRRLFRRQTAGDAFRFLFRDGALWHALRNFAIYLKPGFHPSQIDNDRLATRFLDSKVTEGELTEFPAGQ